MITVLFGLVVGLSLSLDAPSEEGPSEPSSPSPKVVAPDKAPKPSETPSEASIDLSVWDEVAYCESRNTWDIDTGNTFYGGLQFTKQSWYGVGGNEFAAMPHLASKAEQIAAARRLLAMQGPGAWPLCSKYAGLTEENGHASLEAEPV